MTTNEYEPGPASGTQEPGPEGLPPHDGPRVTRDQMRDVRRLRRPAQRTVAGVSTGLARHFDVDPILFRIAFVVLAFFGGAGLLLYGALWLLMPEDGAERAPLHLDEHSRGLALVGVLVLAGLLVLGDSWGGLNFPWPLAVVALVIWFFVFRDRGPSAGTPGYGTPGYGAPGYATSPPGTPGQAPSYDAPATSTAAPTSADLPAGLPPDGTGSVAGGGSGPGAPTGYAWTPPPPPPPRPRDPRRRGPLLFGFTVALIIFALGCLGLADVAGAPVLASAYPALALGIVATMLLVGAFYGRAGGLIALGLVAALLTAGVTAAERSSHEAVTERPVSASTLDSEYWVSAGELVLDLTEIDDLESLDGRTIDLGTAAGRIEVIVPDGLDVQVNGRVNGPGSLELFGVERGGIGVSWSQALEAGPGEHPRIDLDIEIAVGEIVVRSES